jgi:hypothetical protein
MRKILGLRKRCHAFQCRIQVHTPPPVRSLHHVASTPVRNSIPSLHAFRSNLGQLRPN